MTRKSKMRLLRGGASLLARALLFGVSLQSTIVSGQTPGIVNSPQVTSTSTVGSIADTGKATLGVSAPPGYILGPNDEIVINALHAEEVSGRPYRISVTGDINVPIIGRIHAAGMSVGDLEAEVAERLKRIVREPDVVINISQFKSQPVSVFGEVGSPGVYQLEGRKTLVDIIAMAGGVKESAGSMIKITRRKDVGIIPLPFVTSDDAYSVAEVNVKSIMEATRPEDNIQILPNDIISVARAHIVYILGEVKRPGGFTLTDNRSMSLIEALARAEGPTGITSKMKDAKIIRPVPGSTRIEIAVNLDDVLKGKAPDLILQPDDILYVPSSYARGTFRRTMEQILQMSTGMIIYH